MKIGKIVNIADIDRCPRKSLLPDHYRDDGTCKCVPSDLELAQERQRMILAGEPQRDLEHAESLGQRTWTTAELQEDYEVLGYAAPFVTVRRKLDGKLGSLEFVHNPRVYFGWREHDDG